MAMHTQRQLLDYALEKQGLANYTELAKALDISSQAMSQFKYGTPLSDKLALAVARLCSFEPAYVLACVEYHRAERLDETNPALPTWQKIAEAFADKARQTAANRKITGAGAIATLALAQQAAALLVSKL